MRALLCGLVLVACVPPREPREAPAEDIPVAPRTQADVLANYEGRLRLAKKKLEEEFVAPKCEVPAISVECGALLTRLVTAEKVTAFAQRNCAGVVDGTCLDRLEAALLLRLGDRYWRSKKAEIDRFCADSPAACTEWGDRESLWMRSHNGAVLDNYRAEVAAAERDFEYGKAAVSEERADRARREQVALQREQLDMQHRAEEAAAWRDAARNVQAALQASAPPPAAIVAPTTVDTRCSRLGIYTNCTSTAR